MHMKPSQARIDVQTSAYERLSQYWKSRGDCKPGVEPWFGLDYIEADIPADVLKTWEQASLPDSIPEELSLPPQNEFIPTDFTLKAKPEPEQPVLGKAYTISMFADVGINHALACDCLPPLAALNCSGPVWQGFNM